MKLNNGSGLILLSVMLFMAGCSTTRPLTHEHHALPVTQLDKRLTENDIVPTESAQRDYERALAFLDSGRNSNAKQQLQALTQAYPGFSGPYANLGMLYFREGDMKLAEETLNKAVQVNPNNAMAYNQLGILYRHTGKFDQARQAYDRALLINPDYANAHLNLGILYDLFLQDAKLALQHYERYLELSPDKDDQVSLWLADLKQRIINNNISANEIR